MPNGMSDKGNALSNPYVELPVIIRIPPKENNKNNVIKVKKTYEGIFSVRGVLKYSYNINIEKNMIRNKNKNKTPILIMYTNWYRKSGVVLTTVRCTKVIPSFSKKEFNIVSTILTVFSKYNSIPIKYARKVVPKNEVTIINCAFFG
jgi:hypothetical protein